MDDNPSGAGASNPLTQKLGPLPAWGWVAIAGAIGFVWFYARKKSTPAEVPVTNTVTTPSADSADVTGQLATLGAQIRDLQGSGSVVDTNPDSAVSVANYSQLPQIKSPDPTRPHRTGPLAANASLQNLAVSLWGDPNGARWLYAVNEDLIENAARAAGHQSSEDGQILVPGINLLVPEALVKTPAEGRVSGS